MTRDLFFYLAQDQIPHPPPAVRNDKRNIHSHMSRGFDNRVHRLQGPSLNRSPC